MKENTCVTEKQELLQNEKNNSQPPKQKKRTKLVKNISPKNSKEKSVNVKGTPELHKLFRKMKDKQELNKKNDEKE